MSFCIILLLSLQCCIHQQRIIFALGDYTHAIDYLTLCMQNWFIEYLVYVGYAHASTCNKDTVVTNAQHIQQQ